MRQKLTDALAKYVGVLMESANQTSRVEDRLLYTKHLAEAAIMFTLIHQDAPPQQVRDKVVRERRAFGWGYLSGIEGEAAEGAFQEFAKLVDGE